MRAELDRTGLPLVGRARELDAISASLESARGGNGGLLCIIGDAGIGKTRLAAEAMRMARSAGFTCAWGSGWSEGGSPPLWPWPSIVEQLGQRAEPGSLLSGVTPGDVEAERFAQFRSVSRAIARATELNPVMIVIDNAQTADAGALLLARFVIRSLPASDVFFVITARTPNPDVPDEATIAEIAREGVVLRPAPLTVAVVRDMLRDLGWTDSDRRIEEVHRLTGGNPLLVNELVASTEPGHPVEARSVRAIMELRTRDLNAGEQHILRVVAILGALAHVPLIAAVADASHDDAEAALLFAAATGVIRRNESGTYVFAHDLMAEAALAACAPTERAALHERAVQSLMVGANANVERASAAAHHHLTLARLRGDVDSIAAAGSTCTLAAGMLVERFAYEAAARLLAESIELHDHAGVPVDPDMLLGVARAELAAGNLRGARPWFWRAAEHADTPARLAQAALGLGGIWVDEHRNAIDHASFMALIERALEGLSTAAAAEGPQAGRPDLRARLEVRQAAERVYLGLAAPSMVSAAVERARAVGDPLVLAEVLSLQLHTMLGPASAESREPLAEEIVAAATMAGDEVLAVMGVLWRTVNRILQGDPRAERSLNELRERADALQIAAVLFVVAAIDVMRLLRKGLIVEAELAVQQCFELGTSIGDADAVTYYGAHLMSIRWLQGEAGSILPLAREVANSPMLVEGDITYSAAVAALAAVAGETDEARATLARVMDRPMLAAAATSSNWMMWMFCIAEAAFVLGDGSTARRVYDMLLPYREQPMIGSLGVVCFGSSERTLGIAARTFGDLDLAVDHLERAVEANQHLGNAVLAAIATGDLGCTLTERALGTDRARGRVLLESAMATLTEMGLPSRVDALRAYADANSSDPTGHVRLDDGTWHIRFGDDDVELADSIGVRRLAQLLERPFVDVPVADLVGGLDQATRQELMDSAALRSYRDRISELHAEIDEADDNNDLVRAERARTELDTLLEHITASAALGQRSRQFTNSQERARVAVRKSLSRVFDDISAQAPRLGGLLSECIRTGNVCRFEPRDPLPAVWQRS